MGLEGHPIFVLLIHYFQAVHKKTHNGVLCPSVHKCVLPVKPLRGFQFNMLPVVCFERFTANFILVGIRLTEYETRINFVKERSLLNTLEYTICTAGCIFTGKTNNIYIYRKFVSVYVRSSRETSNMSLNSGLLQSVVQYKYLCWSFLLQE